MCRFSRQPEHPDLTAEQKRLRAAQAELAKAKRQTPKAQELAWDVKRHRAENNLSAILSTLFVTPKDKDR